MLEELVETQAEVAAKARQLAEWIAAAKHCVVFTGAGISTSAGIPDFRGPSGVWTLAAQGKSAHSRVQLEAAVPTVTHMAIKALVDVGLVKHVISQNVDGMHRKSGLTAALSELHGNTNLEVCGQCGREYLRDYGVRTARGVHEHDTGRRCAVPGCGGPLRDSIVNFGENLPKGPLDAAMRHSGKSDLHIVLGSSLTVSPACHMPERSQKAGGRLVIVNLQRTPLDDMASLRLHAPCDAVMMQVMQHLRCAIPPFVLRRHVVLWRPSPQKVAVAGLEADGIPASFFRKVLVPGTGKALTREPFIGSCPDHKPWDVTLTFFGHYGEPDVGLQLTSGRGSAHYELAFNPLADTQWTVSSVSPANATVPTSAVPDDQSSEAASSGPRDARTGGITGGGTGGPWHAVSPLPDCPHTRPGVRPDGMAIDLEAPCAACGNVGENMQCLACHVVRCGRHVAGHMLQHHGE
eukprot:EG_transcript_12085